MLEDVAGEALSGIWTTAAELVLSAGTWAVAGAGLGVVSALVLTPLAARWTRGGWAVGCAWALLLVTVLGAGGLYGGAVYGAARQGERLVEQEWLLERVAAATLIVVAEERGLDAGAALSIGPMIAETRTRLESRTAAGTLPGTAILGLGLPQLLGSVLDSLEGLDGLTVDDLHALLRFEADDATPVEAREARLSPPARRLLASTAPVRHRAVTTIWASALPHFVAVAVIAGATMALIFLIGVISRLLGRRRVPA